MKFSRMKSPAQIYSIIFCTIMIILSITINPAAINLSDQRNTVKIIQEPTSQGSTLKNASVYVNASLYPSIQGEIAQYIKDVESEGFNITLNLWFDPSPSEFIRAQTLRTHLNNSYNMNNTVGAVLIGEFPVPKFDGSDLDITYRYPDYPVDLFYMDLDGSWVDLGADGDYDIHSNGTGDMYPEIFVSRIDTNKTSLTNPIQELKNYFNRTHDYRIGNTPRIDSGLMYIDDPWESYSHEWKKDFEFLYTNITLKNNSNTVSNAPDFTNEVLKPYEFTHLFCHSDWHRHYFDASTGSETQLLNSQIKTMDTNSLFYNLYCCYGSKIDEVDNLGSLYLFSSNHSLAVYGCSRSGGFVMNQYLYEPLSKNETLGESFFNWWFNDILDPVVHTHGPDSPDSRGNILLGDPFLRIKNVTSSTVNMVPTILTQSQTINANNITLQWTSTPSTDYYNIYVNGIFNTTSTDTQEIVMLMVNGTYIISVTAIDYAGWEYGQSASITIIVAIEPAGGNNNPGTNGIPSYSSFIIITMLFLGVIYTIKSKKLI